MYTDQNTNRKIIIAIDGFSSCGKSTFAKAIARRLGYIFIDTGAMYRAVTFYALEHGAIRSGMVDEDAVVRLLPEICIDFRFNPELAAEGKNPLTLDSKAPSASYRDFILNETRYTSLQRTFPDRAETLFAQSESAAKDKYAHLLKLVALYGSEE